MWLEKEGEGGKDQPERVAGECGMREWDGQASTAKSPGGAPRTCCFQLLADGWREVLHTCPAWRVSQNQLMVLAFVWQVKALQAVAKVEVVKLWQAEAQCCWSRGPEVRGWDEALRVPGCGGQSGQLVGG